MQTYKDELHIKLEFMQIDLHKTNLWSLDFDFYGNVSCPDIFRINIADIELKLGTNIS